MPAIFQVEQRDNKNTHHSSLITDHGSLITDYSFPNSNDYSCKYTTNDIVKTVDSRESYWPFLIQIRIANGSSRKTYSCDQPDLTASHPPIGMNPGYDQSQPDTGYDDRNKGTYQDTGKSFSSIRIIHIHAGGFDPRVSE